ncbi:phage tail protein [Rahnella sp. L72c]|uniref:Phage tail protein n=1 Tax=Rahnella perminowiae TaxID=2816244 RepID=A0ABS6L6D8_9GAMM|nr:phage tail protein [Rahnella perminowiae]MBU9837344.1 phage tail protein [Rahnella perminowiae]
MMLTLGLFVFQLQTVPYQSLQRDVDYRWPANNRVGLRPLPQFLGVNEEKITLSGVLMPEITGGKLSLMTLNLMADEGKAWPLLEGSGTIYGMFVVNSVSETHTEFFSNGAPRKIEFTLTLTRVDESLTAMFGDMKAQADGLLNQAGGLTGQLGGLL